MDFFDHVDNFFDTLLGDTPVQQQRRQEDFYIRNMRDGHQARTGENLSLKQMRKALRKLGYDV